jgi:hypothetical protein
MDSFLLPELRGIVRFYLVLLDRHRLRLVCKILSEEDRRLFAQECRPWVFPTRAFDWYPELALWYFCLADLAVLAEKHGLVFRTTGVEFKLVAPGAVFIAPTTVLASFDIASITVNRFKSDKDNTTEYIFVLVAEYRLNQNPAGTWHVFVDLDHASRSKPYDEWYCARDLHTIVDKAPNVAQHAMCPMSADWSFPAIRFKLDYKPFRHAAEAKK